METRTIYRFENPVGKDGLWYTKDGHYRKSIHLICPNGIAKDFPMPKNLELHRKDGKIWNSGGKSKDNVKQWFTVPDALSLYRHGFRLFEFETTMFQELEMEILFCRDGVIRQKEIPLESIYDIESALFHNIGG